MWIVVESGDLEGQAVEIAGERFFVGRDEGCGLTLPDTQVSGRHLLFAAADGGVTVEDLGSTNGTILDGRRIGGPVALAGGEHLRLGRTVLSIARTRPGGEGGSTVIAPARPPAGAAAATPPAAVPPAAPPPAAPAAPEPAAPAAPEPAAAAAVPPPAAAPAPGTPVAAPEPGAPAPGAPPPGAPGPFPPDAPFARAAATPSSIERAKLRRSVNWAVAIAVGAVVVAVVAIVLAVTGVFSGGGTPTVADVVAKVSPSTLLVVASRNGQPAEKGTAWVLDGAHGLVVTNNHVAQGGDSLSVGTGGGLTGTVAMSSHAATIVGTAPCEDIAVLRVAGARGLRSLPLADQSRLQAGDGVIALGFPVNASLNDNLVATSGIVSVPHTQFSASASGANDVPDLPNVVQTTAAINPGNSGGPLVNFQGEVVGMDSAGLDQNQGRTVQGEGYAIGSARLGEIVARLRTGRSIGWAGFGLDYPDPQALQSKGLPSGLIVNYTEPGSPASQIAAFQSGPVLITSINGHTLDTTLQSYCAAVQGIDGKTVPVTVVLNDGTEGTVQVPFQ